MAVNHYSTGGFIDLRILVPDLHLATRKYFLLYGFEIYAMIPEFEDAKCFEY
jgi:hypothetical protein